MNGAKKETFLGVKAVKKKTVKKRRPYIEPPRYRKERKLKEYRMATIRTVGTIIGAIVAVASLTVNALIFLKVYAHV